MRTKMGCPSGTARTTQMADSKNSPSTETQWKVRSTKVHFENKIMRLKEDHLQLPDGSEMDYAFIERGPAVIVVPVTPDGRIILIRQFRHPAREECLEVPAGTARDAQGMSLEEVAAKELKEEVGVRFARIESVGKFFSNPSLCDEECEAFIAFGAEMVQRPEQEQGEEIETILVPIAEAMAMARAGKVRTGPAALALFLAEPRLSEGSF